MTHANRSRTKEARGTVLLAAVVVLGAGALGVLPLGCSTEDEIRFGDPSCVAGRCESGPTGAASGGSAASTDCPGKGVEGPECPSWKSEIFDPIVDESGAGQCAASGCHSGTIDSDLVLVPGDAKATRLALLTYQFKDPAGRYVSCEAPENSMILCNLSEADTCGKLMPQIVKPKLDQTQIDLFAEWIKCGAPDN